jgi:hypothetical protein
METRVEGNVKCILDKNKQTKNKKKKGNLKKTQSKPILERGKMIQ